MADNVHETGILVVGGGIAGCFLTTLACRIGADVNLATVIISNMILIYNSDWDDYLPIWLHQFIKVRKYINNLR